MFDLKLHSKEERPGGKKLHEILSVQAPFQGKSFQGMVGSCDASRGIERNDWQILLLG
jgi:hypothetical protein